MGTRRHEQHPPGECGVRPRLGARAAPLLQALPLLLPQRRLPALLQLPRHEGGAWHAAGRWGQLRAKRSLLGPGEQNPPRACTMLGVWLWLSTADDARGAPCPAVPRCPQAGQGTPPVSRSRAGPHTSLISSQVSPGHFGGHHRHYKPPLWHLWMPPAPAGPHALVSPSPWPHRAIMAPLPRSRNSRTPASRSPHGHGAPGDSSRVPEVAAAPPAPCSQAGAGSR